VVSGWKVRVRAARRVLRWMVRRVAEARKVGDQSRPVRLLAASQVMGP
jgi:hypothetical protein